MMRKKNKRILAVLFALAILCTSVTAGAVSQYTKTVTALYGINITLDGEPFVGTDVNGKVVQPMAVDGTTYLPVRALSEALGMGVVWDGATNTVQLTSEPTDGWTPVNTAFVNKMNANSFNQRLDCAWFNYTNDAELLATAGDLGYKNGFVYINDEPDSRWLDKAYIYMDLAGEYDTLYFEVAFDSSEVEYGDVSISVYDRNVGTLFKKKEIVPGKTVFECNIDGANELYIAVDDTLTGSLSGYNGKEFRSMVIGNMKLR